jgi:hypothetical protein
MAALRAPVGTDERQGYAVALAGLWVSLSRTLAELDALAATPAEQLVYDGRDVLPRLQYELHAAGELALGIEPPPGTEAAHAELTAALAQARDATGEMLDAVEAGTVEATAALTYEWRGALFGVRLARLRLGAASSNAAFFDEVERHGAVQRSAVTAALVIVATAGALVASATLGFSPLFVVGLLLVVGAVLVARP